ncbi:MAG: PHP domain-containing protein [Cellulosilyticaceae bacterium]
MTQKIDLHIHSRMSDGTCSPKEIVTLAVENSVKVIALTDHDTIDGLQEAQEEAQKQGVKLLKGMEFTCPYVGGRLLHILGIGIDVENPEFLKAYTRMKEKKEQSLENILGIIAKQGVNISLQVLKERAITKYIDRVDIARYLLHEGIVATAVEGWNKYLDPIPYGDDELIGVEEAFDIIQKAGGVSVLAHYTKHIGLAGYTKEEVEQHIGYLKSKGLQALERYYPSFTEEEVAYADYLIEKYELLASGGTDFHGKHRPGLDVGIGSDGFYVPYSVYEAMSRAMRPSGRR